MNYRVFEKIEHNELIKNFLDKFNGLFSIETPAGEVYYEDEEGEWYKTPETKDQLFNMINDSLKQNKNLFLDNKYDEEQEII